MIKRIVESARASSYTSWVHRRDDDGRFVRVPRRMTDGFLRGEAALPSSNEYVYLATLLIELANRKPVRIASEWFTKHKVLSNGLLDPEYDRDASCTWINHRHQKTTRATNA